MRLTNISEVIGCDHDSYLVLRDALQVQSADFDDQSHVMVSDQFLKAFPPTRAREPLSGLWDHFDHAGLGSIWGPRYQQSGLDVGWRDSGAWIRAVNAEVSLSSMASIIQTACARYLPLTVSWNGANHDFASGSIVGGCLKIAEDGVEGMTTWDQLEAWGRKMNHAPRAPRPIPTSADTEHLVSRIRASAIRNTTIHGKGGRILVYIPAALPPIERVNKYEDPLTLILRAHRGSCVEGGATWLNTPGGSEQDLAGCEIVISSGNVESTCQLLRTKLPGGEIPPGSQLQYRAGGLRYDEWDGNIWRVRDQKCSRRVMGKCVSKREAAR